MGVSELRPIGEAEEGLVDVLAAEAEVRPSLLANGDDERLGALALELDHQTLSGAKCRGVVGTREASIADDDHDDGHVDLLRCAEHLLGRVWVALGRFDDDPSHAVSIRSVLRDPRLRTCDL